MAKWISGSRGLLPYFNGKATVLVLRRPAATAPAISNVRKNERKGRDEAAIISLNTVSPSTVSPSTGHRHTPAPLHRSLEWNPTKHNSQHEGMFYNISNEDMGRYFSKGLRLEYYSQSKAFLESALMVRTPALELISYLRSSSKSRPVLRYILYGTDGSGKTCSLVHAMHFAAKDGWMILYLPWPAYLNNYFREVSSSSFKSGRIDTPQEAVEILLDFKRFNKDILEKHELKTVHRYVFSRRELFEAGTPWTHLIDFGIERPKFSSDVVGGLLKEIRTQSAQLPFRTLLAVDGVNSFWGTTKAKKEDKTFAKPDQFTLVHNFKKMLCSSWANGAVTMTVDKNASPLVLQDSYLPQYLLQKDGFEWVDPFIPIEVSNYTEKETHSCIEYYVDRNWICMPQAKTEDGRKELVFLSGRNPMLLNKICALR